MAGYGYADEGTQMGASGVSSPCGRLPLRKKRGGLLSFLDTRDIVIVKYLLKALLVAKESSFTDKGCSRMSA